MSRLRKSAMLLLSTSLCLCSSAAIFAQDVVTYPNMIGQSVIEAERIASKLGLELLIQRVDAPQAYAQILDQVPPAETPLGTNSRMFLVVADGLVVPDVVNLDIGAAQAELEAMGITVESARRPLEGVPVNRVAFALPGEGTRINAATEAVFLIASSKHLVRVPSNLVGTRRSEVQRLRDLVFRDDIRVQTGSLCWDPPIYHYFVTGSSPAPGKLVEIGTTVDVEYRGVKIRDGRRNCNEEDVPF